MATDNLKGVKVAILVTDGFEQVELTEPRKALQQAGAETQIVSPKSQTVCGWNFTDWGEEFPVDVALDRNPARELRCAAPAGRRYESGLAPHAAQSGQFRQGVFRRR